MSVFFCQYAHPKDRGDIEILKKQISTLQRQVNKLTKNGQDAVTDVVIVEDTSSHMAAPAEAPSVLPATNTGKFRISGFIQMVALYDIDQLGYQFNRDYSYIPQLAYKDEEGVGNTRKGLRMHAKQSRIVFTYDDIGKFCGETYPMHAFMDIDFYNGKEGNGIFTHSFQPRMRSACFDFGNFKIGLFWSLFMDIGNFPVTIDFGSATGTSMLRQPQIRYTHKINDSLSIAGSIENSDSTFIQKDGATHFTRTLDNAAGDYRSSSVFPDLVGALLLHTKQATGGLKVVFSNTRVSPNPKNRGKTVKSIGFGGSLGYILPNNDKLILHCNVGNGLARYLHEAACFGLYYDEEENKFYRHLALGLTAGITHYWKPNLHTSVTMGRTLVRLCDKVLNQPKQVDLGSGLVNNPELAKAENNLFRYCLSFHANLIWNINERIETGIEFLSLRKAPAKFKNPIKTNRKKAMLNRILLHFKMNIN